jgi:hypothetical protein
MLRHDQAHSESIGVGEAWNRANSGFDDTGEASYCFKSVKNQQILQK